VARRHDDAGGDEPFDHVGCTGELGRKRHQGDRARRRPGPDLVEQRLRLGREAGDVGAQMTRREHRAFEVEAERCRRAPIADSMVRLRRQRRHLGDGGRPRGAGSGDDRRQERGDPEAWECRGDVEDPVRFGGDVDAVGTVALQVDEACGDDTLATVDVGLRSPVVVHHVGDDLRDHLAVHHHVGSDQFALDQHVAAVEPPTSHVATVCRVHALDHLTADRKRVWKVSSTPISLR
jgi:hypothetical protein